MSNLRLGIWFRSVLQQCSRHVNLILLSRNVQRRVAILT